MKSIFTYNNNIFKYNLMSIVGNGHLTLILLNKELFLLINNFISLNSPSFQCNILLLYIETVKYVAGCKKWSKPCINLPNLIIK